MINILPEEILKSGRRITFTLFATQSLGSASFIAAATLNSIVSITLSGNASWAGVPSAIYMLGGAFAAFLWGYLMDSMGRRGGLILGALLGAIGAGISYQAVVMHSFLAFLGGMILLGAANAALVLGRFAAAEVQAPENRGRAISTVVLGGTIGAVVGPLLVGLSDQLATVFHYDRQAGVYAIGALLLFLAAFTIFFGLRPEPRDLGKAVAKLFPTTATSATEKRQLTVIFKQPAVIVSMVTMALAQMVMVMVMVITSLHMKNHMHSLTNISMVFSIHALGMFAFSIISGQLADRIGRGFVILIGASGLVLACITASLSPQLLPLSFSLFLLGLGWNFCFVGGSTLLSDQLSPEERAKTQGINDLVVGLASTIGSVLSGVIFALVGFGVMTYIGAGIAFLLTVLIAVWIKKQPVREIINPVVA